MSRGRTSRAQRGGLDAWVAHVVDVIAGYRGDPEGREEYVAHLSAARGRPVPVDA